MIARSADVGRAAVSGQASHAATASAAALAGSQSASSTSRELSDVANSASLAALARIQPSSTAGAAARTPVILPARPIGLGGQTLSEVAEPVASAPRPAEIDSSGPATARLAVRTHAPHRRVNRSRGSGGSGAFSPWPAVSPPSVIDHFVSVVPSFLWLTLGLALSGACAAGLIAVRTGRRVRRQAGELVAVAAAAHTDALTEALNRRGFTDAVERELARARRYQGRFALAYLDVRGLKALNDSEGHPAGDALLREVAQLLKESARDADVVARIGGDEFALLLPEQPADTVDAVTRRIRERVTARRIDMGLTVPWDLTIGTAAFPDDGETFDELVATADRRLYEQRGIELGAGHRAG